MLLVRAADDKGTLVIIGQRHSEVGLPVPFSAVVRFPVLDQYPLRLCGPKRGRQRGGASPLPFALQTGAPPHRFHKKKYTRIFRSLFDQKIIIALILRLLRLFTTARGAAHYR